MKGAQVATLPKPTLTDTVQFGSVWKSGRATLDLDVYHIVYQNDYSSATDAVTGDTNWFSNGKATTKGFEAESTILVGGGLAVYLNGTVGSARYADTGQWAQNTPRDTETLGLTYNQGNWNFGFFNKRVGRLFNDNGAVHQAFVIDPFNSRTCSSTTRCEAVETLSVENPSGREQPDGQSQHHRRAEGWDSEVDVRNTGRGRSADGDAGTQRVGVVHGRLRHKDSLGGGADINERGASYAEADS